ncbi:MAG TPA: RIP metalloprotease RseP [Terriglobia bacterium]|nr:RIP metalloprotease RseP [Terriglobia bacterium]
MSDALSSIGIALVVLGVIIVIHELGHFLVAKFFKIKVETFSVGFGPRLFGFKYGETDYRISALPLGGYVKMSGENPGDTITGDPREFMSKPKWQRFLVAAAGPFMNIVLAVGLLTGLFMYGAEVAEYMSSIAIVGYVEPGSPAEQAGIRTGDRIVSIQGKERPDWQDVGSRVFINPEQSLPVTVERDAQRIDVTLTPSRQTNPDGGFSGMGPPYPGMVEQVFPGKPAEKAGIEVGDEIVAVDGIDLKRHGESLQTVLQEVKKETFPITVRRNGELKELSISPVADENSGKKQKVIGIAIDWPRVKIKLGFVDAFYLSLDKNKENATLILTVLGKLFKSPENGGLPVGTLEGPIGIVRVSGNAFKLGLGPLIFVMAMISLNLGLLNLLPVPILDGGVMLLIAIEGLIRRDLSLRVKERIVQVSFVAMLMLTAFVIYNDIVKLLPSSPGNP